VREKEGVLIEVGPYETELTPFCNISLRGKAGEVLPRIVEYIKVKLQETESLL
jgi:NAD-dependent SIR2 family protein deacetylase